MGLHNTGATLTASAPDEVRWEMGAALHGSDSRWGAGGKFHVLCRNMVRPEQGEASSSRRSQEPLRSWRTEPEPGSWCPILPKRGAKGRVLDRQASEWADSWQGCSKGLLQLAEHLGSAVSLPADQAPGTYPQRNLTRLGGGLDWWAAPGPAPRQRVL